MTKRNFSLANEPSKSANTLTIDHHSQPDDTNGYSNLTRLQLLYWAGQKLRPETPLFNAIMLFTISGEVDLEHFQRAFQALLNHSDALRIVIEDIDEGVKQRVIQNLEYTLEYIDFSAQPEPEMAFESWLQKRRLVPLKLEECSFDSALIKISTDQFIWYLNQHHIITDGSAAFLIFERLAEFYKRSLKQEAMEMAGLSAFMDYVDYELAYQNSAQYHKAEAYWNRKLTPGPEPISFYGQAPQKKTTQIQRISYDLGLERSQKLRTKANQVAIFTVSEDLSLYNIFAALFFDLLHQMSGNRHLGIVTPVHNRFAQTFKDIIGLIMELCPLQIEISEKDTFETLIRKVKRETRETLTHYQYGSGLSLQNQTFDAMFNMYHVPTSYLNGMPVQSRRIHPGHGNESVALHVNDVDSSRCFVLHFDLHCDVFNEAQREEIIQSFVQLMDAFLDDSAQLINEISLSVANKKHLLPTNDKLDRQVRLRSDLSQGELYRALVGHRDPLEFQLTQIWEDVFGIRPIDAKDNFFDLGGSSRLAVGLFAQIEKVTGKNLSLSTLLKAATIEDQANLLRQEGWSASWSSLVPIQPRGSKSPFFCVHGGGGNVIHYRILAHHLGPDQPFYGLQPKGMDGKQDFLTRVEDMAAHYIEEIRTVQPEGPYFLGGYCFGGTVAFEMAQQLHKQGQEVALLVSFDGATRDYAGLLGNRRDRFYRQLSNISQLKPREILAYVRDRAEWRIRRVGRGVKRRLQKIEIIHKLYPGLGRPVPIPHPPHHYQMVAAIHHAYREYEPQPYPGRSILFRIDDKHDHQLGWGRLVEGGVKVHQIPGKNSMEIFKEPHVQILAEKLRAYLDEIQATMVGE